MSPSPARVKTLSSIAPYKGSNTFREVLAAALWRTTQENEELRPCLSISHLGYMPEGDDANDEKIGFGTGVCSKGRTAV